MKFPQQKEAFYLRRMLLHHPKRSFDDCRTHLGRKYPTFEQAMLATGRFSNNTEAHDTIQELIQL
eukprot:3530406-Pyramimonas_sp.AAC.1